MMQQIANFIVDHDPMMVIRRTHDTVRYIRWEWAGITEGRVAIVFDNSPEVILAPCNLNMLLHIPPEAGSEKRAGEGTDYEG